MPAGQKAAGQKHHKRVWDRAKTSNAADAHRVRLPAQAAAMRSLATCRKLIRGPVSICQSNSTNPKLATNRVARRHSLNSQHYQFGSGSGIESSPYLFPETFVLEFLASKVTCASKLVRKQKSWPTRSLQTFRLEIGREYVLRIRLDWNELANACVFDPTTVKCDGKRTMTGMHLGWVERQRNIGQLVIQPIEAAVQHRQAEIAVNDKVLRRRLISRKI